MIYLLIVIILILASSIFFSSYFSLNLAHRQYLNEKVSSLRARSSNVLRKIEDRISNLTAAFESPLSGSSYSVGSSIFDIKTKTATCQQHFSLHCNMYPYVKFWNSHLNDQDCYVSPGRHLLKSNAPIEEQKFVIFEPDRGGWNNVRMAAETAMVFALASGRTLVIPPPVVFRMLSNNLDESENESSFQTFFDLKKITDIIGK